MTAVRHILNHKGHQVWSVHPGDTVYDAIKMMADKDVGALVVLDASKIVGIVTERDYARNVRSRIAADASRRNHAARGGLR
jgi:CBS domain-containing protein